VNQELNENENLENRFGNNTPWCGSLLIVVILQNPLYGATAHYIARSGRLFFGTHFLFLKFSSKYFAN